ncbi:hypothetical protein GCM10023403_20240 [Pseudonocardia benzenivorans]|nr:hypothetical protein PSD17_40150 [Pseudonocardia sp. D17]
MSFSCPSDRGCIVMDTIGGLRPTHVKKEMGARFATPSTDIVLIHPIGRGTMLPISSLYAEAASSVEVSMIIGRLAPIVRCGRDRLPTT